MVLMLEAGLFGTFTALNFFHWFMYWELSLVPAFFLIKLWGGPQRSAAALQFFIYTMVGSVAMLLSFLAIYQAVGTFDFAKLADLGRSGELAAQADRLGWHDCPATIALVIFAGVFLGFAVKIPIVPFHTWLPSAYSEAPVGVTMLLTGLMSKMGVYGKLRIMLPIFPERDAAGLDATAVAGGGNNRVVRVRGFCTNRPEARVRVLLDQPSWLLSAGCVRAGEAHRQRTRPGTWKRRRC